MSRFKVTERKEGTDPEAVRDSGGGGRGGGGRGGGGGGGAGEER